MIGKAMRFATVCTLAFAIFGEANRDKVASVSKETTEDLEPSKTSVRSRAWRLAVLALSSAVTPADAWVSTNKPLDGTHHMLPPANANHANFAPNLAAPKVISRGVRVELKSGAAVVPHPDKADRKYSLPPTLGGEDAYFVEDESGVVGVADGVGGWASLGIDPGLYSRELMQFAGEAVRSGELGPSEVLLRAHAKSKALGASTALIVALSSQADGAASIVAANLGDSGLLVLRNGHVILQSTAQQHSFNFPFQLGAPGASSDSPADAERIELLGIQPGDVVLLGTDGLFDNLFVDEIAAAVVIEEAFEEKETLAQRAANRVAQDAAQRARDLVYMSPFATEARRSGYSYSGGKLDDITVVVSVVVPAGQAKKPMPPAAVGAKETK